MSGENKRLSGVIRLRPGPKTARKNLNNEQGTRNIEQGVRNIERLPWRVSLLATHAEPEPLIRITCLKATFYTYSR